jgi:replication-associated recombination protein RarA
MKQLDYGKGYEYAHNDREAVTGMDCLPPSLAGKTTTNRPSVVSRRRLNGGSRRGRRSNSSELPDRPDQSDAER